MPANTMSSCGSNGKSIWKFVLNMAVSVSKNVIKQNKRWINQTEINGYLW